MKNYHRVIPRDFFNEAKLLNCMGHVALKILNNRLPKGIDLFISDSGEPFDIVLLDEGSLTIDNYRVRVNGRWKTFKTTYNSKSKYPLYCEHNLVDYEVFDENGEFTEEFINQFKTLE